MRAQGAHHYGDVWPDMEGRGGRGVGCGVRRVRTVCATCALFSDAMRVEEGGGMRVEEGGAVLGAQGAHGVCHMCYVFMWNASAKGDERVEEWGVVRVGCAGHEGENRESGMGRGRGRGQQDVGRMIGCGAKRGRIDVMIDEGGERFGAIRRMKRSANFEWGWGEGEREEYKERCARGRKALSLWPVLSGDGSLRIL